MTAHRTLPRALWPAAACGLALAVAGAGFQAVAPAERPAAPPTPKSDPGAESAVKALSESFAAAYNRRDADAVAALFTEDARVVEEDGFTVDGKEAIRARFADSFRSPEALTLRLDVSTVRFLAPGVAIEDGVLVGKPEAFKGEGRRSPFTALHVLRDGRWLTAEVRDRAEAPGAPDDGDAALEELSWLVGDWVDESEQGVVETTCRKSEDGNFLLREFTLKVGGEVAAKGVQRIGWDPVRGQLRSWVFDDDGGFNEGQWSRIGPDEWVVKTDGYLRDGRLVSATNVVTKTGPDAFKWASTHRMIGEAFVGDVEEIRIVRKPPAPR